MEINLIIAIAIAVAAFFAGAVPAWLISFKKGFAHRMKIAESEIGSAEAQAKKIISEAKSKSEATQKEIIIEAKEEIHKLRTESERELKDRRREVNKLEQRLQQKEESIDKKVDNLEKKEEKIQSKLKDIESKLEETEVLKRNQLSQLERISGLTQSQAQDQLLTKLDNELVHEKAVKIAAYNNQLKDEADEKAREILSLAISRLSAEHASEATVSVVPLPNDDMKGRIIGREGRNIKALETLTGVDLIIDDTPEAITLSCFDPVRREVARIALERLIIDGRIHPARIEEMVEKGKREVEQKIRVDGERAVMDTNVNGINHELVKLFGRLTFRTSYGQNVLDHSVEVALLAGMMASEIGADVRLARRAGLLHDIGKALNHEIEGSHVEIGVDVCKKYKEHWEVIHAIESHHGDVEAKTVIAGLVQAADAVSASRPGARRENLDSYIKRLEKIEEIANSFEGVEKSYAIQAGREIRIMIKPEVIKDEGMVLVARNIVKKIEEGVDYPGQIKVHLIRESRAIEFAK
ncbi:MAG: ribonuclease Y [Oscillospiraceae bacterium]|nr:ribonuclease Y [Oscillospiraceae bacterium]